MRSLGGSIIFLLVMLLVDFYIFQAIKAVTINAGNRVKWVTYASYWVCCAVGILFITAMPYLQTDYLQKTVRTYLFALVIGFFLAQLLALPFLLIDDLRRLVQWIIAQFVTKTTDASPGHEAAEVFNRSIFLSWLGLGIGGSLFATLIYGFRNKYNYQVKKLQLAFSNLPQAFRGLRIVQISDIHSGSFTDALAVMEGVDLVNKQHPDLILFTGDLVNDRATEMEPYMHIFSKLAAPLGIFSTFGNHDYGDYVRWESEAHKAENLRSLADIHASMGWRLLMDENITLEKDGAYIGLIGVQNISGKGRFHSYGSLAKAYEGVGHLPFKILMSHDPSHWDAEVRPNYPDIDLMLSGHTHGMQFGMEIPGFKWSPVKWMYRQWADLYEEGRQKLYVNRGFGFIGYPGRVGILPEITVIELV